VDYFAAGLENKGLLYLGGQRVASVMVCLSANCVGCGGEVIFPQLAAGGLTVDTSIGQALLWLNVRPDGEVEERLSYTSAPLANKKANKVYLRLWLHAYPVQEAVGVPAANRPAPAASDALPKVPCPPRPRAAPENHSTSEVAAKGKAAVVSAKIDMRFQALSQVQADTASPVMSPMAAPSGSTGQAVTQGLVFEVID